MVKYLAAATAEKKKYNECKRRRRVHDEEVKLEKKFALRTSCNFQLVHQAEQEWVAAFLWKLFAK